MTDMRNNPATDLSDSDCLDILSQAALQLGIQWPDSVHDKRAEALAIARGLRNDLQRLCCSGETKAEDPVNLTELEQQVLKWAGLGKGAAVTAQIMGISERSVRKARETIGKKLDSNSVLLSVAIATRLGLL